MPPPDAPEEKPASGAGSVQIFRVEPTDDPATIALIGELDIAGIPALSRAIAAVPSATDGLAFDLSKLTFIDSSGLNELLKTARDHPAPIRLLSPQANVMRVLDIAGVLSAFEVVDPQSDDSD